MIPFFKKYQLASLDGDKQKGVFDVGMLGSTAQNFIEGDDEETAALRVKHLNLMETVRGIAEWSTPADMAIMYEVTGWQGEDHQD